MSKFEKLFTPLKVNEKFTMRNRLCCGPMAFALIACDPEACDKSFRKLEAPARGGDAIVSVGELDVNFRDADRIPLPPIDFTETTGYVVNQVGEYARRIQKHGAIALCELAHPGAEKMPFHEKQEAIGPNDEIRPNGVHVRAMTKEDMDRITKDFVTAAKFTKNCGYDGVLIHGGHGFLFTQFLSPIYNKRIDEYGGSLENRARFPIQILRGIREAMGSDFIIELRISGTDGYKNGITPEETGKFIHSLEGIIDLVQVSAGIYYDAIETHQFTSMFVPHGVNAAVSEIIKKYTTIPVGVVGGINAPEQMEEILETGKADYIVCGRQSIADPELANKAMAGKEDGIRRCLRCFKCFPGSPEEGYADLPFTSNELAKQVGYCTINPCANLPFSPWDMETPNSIKKVLIVGGGPAGMQAAITASDRGHQVILLEKEDKLGGLLSFTEMDIDKPDLRNFKNTLIGEVGRHKIDVRLHTTADAELIKELAPDEIILATGSEPNFPPISGIKNAAQSLEAYKGNVAVGKKVIFIGGGLVGSEHSLFLAKTGHEVVIVEKLLRVADEAYGMYREALVNEMKKENITLLENTCCMEIGKNYVRVKVPDGTEQTLKGDTVLYALGMHSVNVDDLKKAAGEIHVTVIGDAICPGKVDQATRTGYFAAIEIGK